MNILAIALFIIGLIILVLHTIKPIFIQRNHILNRIINDQGGILALAIFMGGLAAIMIGNQREMIAILHQIQITLQE